MMGVMRHSETSLLDGLKQNLALAMTFLPRKTKPAQITAGAPFEAEITPLQDLRSSDDAVPLAPCKPLNTAERDEAEMMARIRGALYAKD